MVCYILNFVWNISSFSPRVFRSPPSVFFLHKCSCFHISYVSFPKSVRLFLHLRSSITFVFLLFFCISLSSCFIASIFLLYSTVSLFLFLSSFFPLLFLFFVFDYIVCFLPRFHSVYFIFYSSVFIFPLYFVHFLPPCLCLFSLLYSIASFSSSLLFILPSSILFPFLLYCLIFPSSLLCCDCSSSVVIMRLPLLFYSVASIFCFFLSNFLFYFISSNCPPLFYCVQFPPILLYPFLFYSIVPLFLYSLQLMPSDPRDLS